MANRINLSGRGRNCLPNGDCDYYTTPDESESGPMKKLDRTQDDDDYYTTPNDAEHRPMNKFDRTQEDNDYYTTPDDSGPNRIAMKILKAKKNTEDHYANENLDLEDPYENENLDLEDPYENENLDLEDPYENDNLDLEDPYENDDIDGGENERMQGSGAGCTLKLETGRKSQGSNGKKVENSRGKKSFWVAVSVIGLVVVLSAVILSISILADERNPDCLAVEGCCYPRGECSGFNMKIVEDVPNVMRCRQECQKEVNQTCNYFTFDKSKSLCMLKESCEEVKSVDNVFSGPANSDDCEVKCWRQGKCTGEPFGTGVAASQTQCLEACRTHSKCGCFSYNYDQTTCKFFTSKFGSDTSVENSVWAQPSCSEPPEPTSFLTFIPNFCTNRYQYIDIENPRRSCSFLTRGDMVFVLGAFLGKTLVACQSPCNGRGTTCYEMTLPGTNSKNPSPTRLSEGRTNAATVMRHPYELKILGGLPSKRSTENLRLQGGTLMISKSIDMPTGLHQHCLVHINDSAIFMAGGWTSHVPQPRAFILTQQKTWLELPPMRYSRARPSCGIVYNEEEIPEIWVAGGYPNNPNVEILSLETQTWRIGPSLPHGIDGAAVFQYNKSIVLVGGITKERKTDGLVLLVFDRALKQWSVMNQTLFYGYSRPYVIPVPYEVDLDCKQLKS